MTESSTPLLLAAAVAGVVVAVWTATALMAVFRKAGRPAWWAWVPLWNLAVLLRLGGYSAWWVILAVIPGANIAFIAVWALAMVRVNRAFGQGRFALFLAIVLLPVWASIVGWGSALYRRPAGRSAATEAAPTEASASGAVPAGPRRGGGVVARGGQDLRIAPSGPTVFGMHGPAGGPGEALRPAASVPGFPSVMPEPSDGPAQPLHTRVGAPIDGSGLPPSTPVFPRTAPVPGLGTRAPESARGPRTDAPAQTRRERSAAARASRFDFDVAVGTTGQSVGPILAMPLDGDTTAGLTSPPVPPVSALPTAREPWVPPARTSGKTLAHASERVPAGGGSGELPADQPAELSAEASGELSGEVSAVAGAPVSGSPRAASTSVSAQQRETADAVIVPDAVSEWALVTPRGDRVALVADVVIIGRRPDPDPAHPGAQLLALHDDTRTVSKTHARLERVDGRWLIVDLDSTNGVVLQGEDGTERDAPRGEPVAITEQFLVGDAVVRVVRSEP